MRRDVQRLYLNALIQMAVSPAPGTPEDARALARMTLAGLGGDLDRALAVPRPDWTPTPARTWPTRASASAGRSTPR